MVDFWRGKSVRQRGWLVVGALVLAGVFWKLTPIMTSHAHRADGYAYLTQALKILGDQNPEPDFCVEGGIANPEAMVLVAQAIEVLEEAREVMPAEAQTWLLLGRGYCLLGRGEEAIEAYERYTELRPENPLGHLELGFAYETRGDFERANSEWQAAEISLQQFIEIGELAQKAGKFESAETQFRRAERLGAHLESSISYLQYLKSQQDNDDQIPSYEALEQAVFVDQGWADENSRRLAWFKWGVWSYEQGNHEEAIKAFQRIIELTPIESSYNIQLSETYRFLGLAYWKVEARKEAVNSLKQAVQLNASNIWGHIHYGKLLYLNDSTQLLLTQQEFTSALNLQPDNLTYWLNLIEFWKWVGEGAQAQALCRDALVKWETEVELLRLCEIAGKP